MYFFSLSYHHNDDPNLDPRLIMYRDKAFPETASLFSSDVIHRVALKQKTSEKTPQKSANKTPQKATKKTPRKSPRRAVKTLAAAVRKSPRGKTSVKLR